MKIFKKSYFLGSLVLFILIITGVKVWSSEKELDTSRITVENKTSSIVVESIKNLRDLEEQTIIELTLRNTSKKDITSLRFLDIGESDAKSKISATERGGLEVTWSLKPDEVIKQRMTVNLNGKIKVIIAAILFADGTSEGIEKDINLLEKKRFGVYLAYSKIVPILEKLITSDDNYLSEEKLQNTEDSIKNLSNDDIPVNYQLGFHLAKNYFGIESEDIRNNKTQNSQYNSNSKIRNILEKIKNGLANFTDAELLKKQIKNKGGQMKINKLNQKASIAVTALIITINIFLAVSLLKDSFAQTIEDNFKNQPQIEVEVLTQYQNPLRFVIVNIDNSDSRFQIVNYTIQNVSEKEIRGYVINAKTERSGKIITNFFPVKSFVSTDIYKQQLWLERENVGKESKLRVFVDYVEFEDGTSWGRDTLGNSENILGSREGAKVAIGRIKNLIVSEDPSTLASLSKKALVDLNIKIPSTFKEKSDRWQKGFRKGYKGIISFLKQNHQKGNDFLIMKFDELENSYLIDGRLK